MMHVFTAAKRLFYFPRLLIEPTSIISVYPFPQAMPIVLVLGEYAVWEAWSDATSIVFILDFCYLLR